MQLVAVTSNDLAVGKPLPWDVVDGDEQPVLARGSTIEDADQLAEITSTPLFRDGAIDAIAPVADPPEADALIAAVPGAVATDSIAPAPDNQFTFSDTHLNIGMRLQLELPSKLGGMSKRVRLIGYLQDICLFVTAPEIEAGTGSLIEGDEVRIRVFSGQHAFGFVCHVNKVLKLPVPHLHLSFPTRIVGKAIRKSRRIRARIAAKIALTDGAIVEGTICNLSATGAEIHVASESARLGDAVVLDFQIVAHGVTAPIKAHAAIRSLTQSTEGSTPSVHCGVEFQDLAASDTLQIQSLVYLELVERPETMA